MCSSEKFGLVLLSMPTYALRHLVKTESACYLASFSLVFCLATRKCGLWAQSVMMPQGCPTPLNE